MRPRFLRLGALVALGAVGLALLLTGCGGGADTRSQMRSTSANQGDAVTIKGFAYAPTDLTVPSGTKVTWTNHDSTSHTATADDGSFDTDTIKPGATGTVDLTKPGTYTYVCQFHPFMKGTITVQG